MTTNVSNVTGEMFGNPAPTLTCDPSGGAETHASRHDLSEQMGTPSQANRHEVRPRTRNRTREASVTAGYWRLEVGLARCARVNRRDHSNWSSHRPLAFRILSDRKSTRLNSSHTVISYAVFCLKKKNKQQAPALMRTATC